MTHAKPGTSDVRGDVDRKPFWYCLDPVCLGAMGLYVLNRMVIKPATGSTGDFWHCYANDLLCLPIWLPVALGLQRLSGIRGHDLVPTQGEIALHWIIWSWFFEGVGPALVGVFPRTVADPLDVVAYALGGILAGWLWRSPRDPFHRGADVWRGWFQHAAGVMAIFMTMAGIAAWQTLARPLDPRQLATVSKGSAGRWPMWYDLQFGIGITFCVANVLVVVWLLQRWLVRPPFRRLSGTEVAAFLLQLTLALVLAWQILASDRSAIGVH